MKKVKILKKTVSIISAALMLVMPMMTQIGFAQTTTTQVLENPEKIALILAEYNNQCPSSRAGDMINAFRTVPTNLSFSPEFKEAVEITLIINDFIAEASENDRVKQMVRERLDALNSAENLKDIQASNNCVVTGPGMLKLAADLSTNEKETLYKLAWEQVGLDMENRLITISEQMTEEQFRISGFQDLESNLLSVFQAVSETTGAFSHNLSQDSFMKALTFTADLLSALIERPAFAFDFTFRGKEYTFNTDQFVVEAAGGAVIVTGLFLGGAVLLGGGAAATVAGGGTAVAGGAAGGGAVVALAPRVGITNRIITAIRDRFRPKEVRDAIENVRRAQAELRAPSGTPITREQQRQLFESLKPLRDPTRPGLTPERALEIAQEEAALRDRIAQQAREAYEAVRRARTPTQAELDAARRALGLAPRLPAPADVVRGTPPPGWSTAGFRAVIEGANRGTGSGTPGALGAAVAGAGAFGAAGTAGAAPQPLAPTLPLPPGGTPSPTGASPTATFGSPADNLPSFLRPPTDQTPPTPQDSIPAPIGLPTLEEPDIIPDSIGIPTFEGSGGGAGLTEAVIPTGRDAQLRVLDDQGNVVPVALRDAQGNIIPPEGDGKSGDGKSGSGDGQPSGGDQSGTTGSGAGEADSGEGKGSGEAAVTQDPNAPTEQERLQTAELKRLIASVQGFTPKIPLPAKATGGDAVTIPTDSGSIVLSEKARSPVTVAVDPAADQVRGSVEGTPIVSSTDKVIFSEDRASNQTALPPVQRCELTGTCNPIEDASATPNTSTTATTVAPKTTPQDSIIVASISPTISDRTSTTLSANLPAINQCAPHYSSFPLSSTEVQKSALPEVCQSSNYICRFQPECSYGLVLSPTSTNTQYTCVAPAPICRQQLTLGLESRRLLTVCDDFSAAETAFAELDKNTDLISRTAETSGPTLFTPISGSPPLCQEGYRFVSGSITDSHTFQYSCIADQPQNPCVGTKLVGSAELDSCCTL